MKEKIVTWEVNLNIYHRTVHHKSVNDTPDNQVVLVKNNKKAKKSKITHLDVIALFKAV